MGNRVLIVDDEVGILMSFKELLQNPTLEIMTASSIYEAETLLKEGEYNAVILDIGLNGMHSEDGLDLLGFIRENRPNTGIIMMTGFGNPMSMEKAYNLGAAFYFEKPVSIDSLQNALISLAVA